MPYSEKLATRITACLDDYPAVEQKKMFGGLCFMVNGHMCCGIVGDDLMLRVGPDHQPRLLRRAHARVMDFTGRPSKGMLYVSPEGIRTKRQLASWLDHALSFVHTLPPKNR